MRSDERSDQSPISESDLLNIIERHLRSDREVPDDEVGIGDDAAVLRFDADRIVLTADAMVDGVHFLSGSMSWHDIGWKSIVSNQSDIAAMGARPEHAMLTLAIPTNAQVGDLEDMLSGIAAALDRFGGKLVGGDTVSSDITIISVAMTGSLVRTGRTLRRDTARPGQLVAVTGELGASAGGLAIMRENGGENGVSDDIKDLLSAHFRPDPRVDLAEPMIDAGVQCAMDISDGLILDLERICIASDVDAVIRAPKVPIRTSLLRTFPDRAAEFALTGGEDYELLYIADAENIASVNAAQPVDRPIDFGVVGEIVPRRGNSPEVTVIDEQGREVQYAGKGWDHFAR